MEMLHSWFSRRGRATYWKWESIAGLVVGILTSLISITCIGILQLLLSSLRRFCATRIFIRPVGLVLIKRACFLLAYCSFVAWLAIEYGKRLGLMDIFSVPKSWHIFL